MDCHGLSGALVCVDSFFRFLSLRVVLLLLVRKSHRNPEILTDSSFLPLDGDTIRLSCQHWQITAHLMCKD
jgi:hypothetical protein